MAPEASRRRYTSPRRQAQAAATRRAVLDAAERLFVAHGYAATSIRLIAAEAGVVPQTVYDVFGDKPALLRALGERQSPDREGGTLSAELAAAPTRAARARLVVRAAVEAAPADDFRTVISDAVSSDARLAGLADWADEQSYADVRRMTATVLGPGVDDATLTSIADRAWATLSTQAVRRLVDRRGWRPGEVEEWALGVILGYLEDAGIDAEAPAEG